MLFHGSPAKLLEGVANYPTIHLSSAMLGMSALDKLCGYSNAEDPVTLHQPSSLPLVGFSPLTSAESHLLDHGPHPH